MKTIKLRHIETMFEELLYKVEIMEGKFKGVVTTVSVASTIDDENGFQALPDFIEYLEDELAAGHITLPAVKEEKAVVASTIEIQNDKIEVKKELQKEVKYMDDYKIIINKQEFTDEDGSDMCDVMITLYDAEDDFQEMVYDEAIITCNEEISAKEMKKLATYFKKHFNNVEVQF